MSQGNLPRTNKTISLDDLLDWVTEHVYDATHIGGLTGEPEWVVDVTPLLTKLSELSGLFDVEMRDAYDWARVRVHGPNVKGGR